MKKALALMLVLCLCLSTLAGCGSTDDQKPSQPAETQPAQTQSAESQPVNETEPPAAGPAFDKDVKLTFATSGKAGSLSALMYEHWMELVTEGSGGKITFDYQSGGVLGNENETLQQIMDGVIEGGVAGISNYSNYNTMMEVYQLPFLINSYETEWAALQTDEWAAIMKDVEAAMGSVYIYGTVDVGMRHIASVDKPVTSLADMEGLKVRTASSEVLLSALKLLGANPIVIGYTEVYSSLSNGIVNAEDVNYMTAVVQSHHEVTHHFTEVGMYPYPSFVCFNKDFIDSLPEGYWDFMRSCMDQAMEEFFTKTIVGADADYRKVLEDAGMEIHTLSDLDDWRAAIQPLYDEYAADGDQKVVDFIKAVEDIKG